MNREQRRIQEVEKRRQEKAEEAQKAKTGGKSAVQRAQSRRTEPADKGNIFQRFVHFLKEVRTEMRRVSWPTRDQMVAFTTVTLITTTALTLFVFALDLGFKAGILWLLERGT